MDLSRINILSPVFLVYLLLAHVHNVHSQQNDDDDNNNNNNNNLLYRHNLRIFECAVPGPIYSFPALEQEYLPPTLDVDYLDMRFDDATHEYRVFMKLDKLNLKPEFRFKLTYRYNATVALNVLVDVVVDSCDRFNVSSNGTCTIVISILSSAVLLLFASLAVALIVLKGRGFNFNIKLWRRCNEAEKNAYNESSQTQYPNESNGGLDINSNRISFVEDHRKDSESSSNDGSPVPPLKMPRKSSLKPPRTEAYPTPEEVEIDIDELPASRRKSMVTFIDPPEVSRRDSL